MLEEVLEISKKLIKAESITPNDGNMLEYISNYLKDLGFKCEFINFNNVKNLYAYCNEEQNSACFAGHIDVVPYGTNWKYAPNDPVIDNGYLYGRGTSDMKVSIAVAMVAFKYALKKNPMLSLSFLITSDEEADAVDGLQKVVPILLNRGLKFKCFILGEPSCDKKILDVVKIGRRGSITANLKIRGIQGHIAYPELADNPIHKSLKFLKELADLDFNDDDIYFGKSKLQITNFDAKNLAQNIIPENLFVNFGVRFNKNQTEESVKNKIIDLIEKHKLNYEINWKFHGNAFICEDKKLMQIMKEEIFKEVGYECIFDAKGATSDGRFLYVLGPVFEVGFQESMAHKVNERVLIDDINIIFKIYLNLFSKF